MKKYIFFVIIFSILFSSILGIYLVKRKSIMARIPLLVKDEPLQPLISPTYIPTEGRKIDIPPGTHDSNGTPFPAPPIAQPPTIEVSESQSGDVSAIVEVDLTGLDDSFGDITID